jgi:hypothetical protein
MTWTQIFIPLGAAIISFFLTQLPDFVDREWATLFLCIGWGLLALCMIYWRWIVHRIDRQIVGLYPRILELEKERKMETQTSYYYRNLHIRSIRHLANMLGICPNELKNKDLRDFKRKMNQKGDPYELLLAVWDKYLHKSVTSRSHYMQDFVVFIILAGFFFTIIYGHTHCWFD